MSKNDAKQILNAVQLKNLFCLDLGNTRIHITAQNFQSQIIRTHLSYDALETKGTHQKFVKLSKLYNFDTVKIIEIPYISVNSKKVTQDCLLKIRAFLKQYLPHKTIKIRPITEKNIFRNFTIPKTFDHRTLGADRALKCIFAYTHSKNIKKNVLVFSFGTATTCEGFSKDGHMIENFVFPGMQMSFSALHHFTALLPKLKADGIQFHKQPEHWTQKIYMKRGVLLSVVCSILTMAKMHAPCKVVLTGGNADIIKTVLFQIENHEILNAYEVDVVHNLETNILAKFYEKFT